MSRRCSQAVRNGKMSGQDESRRFDRCLPNPISNPLITLDGTAEKTDECVWGDDC
jgi:hypothetical protein